MTPEELKVIEERYEDDFQHVGVRPQIRTRCCKCRRQGPSVAEIIHATYCANTDIAALLTGYKELEAKVKELKGDSDMIVLLLEEHGKSFMELTAKLKIHPEDYDRPCVCKECRSYGD